jgi:hypothetical protein
MQRFWKALCLFAYRRWVTAGDTEPVGVPGRRDPAALCSAYAPRPRLLGDWTNCEADGHYLCGGCCHLDRDSEYAIVHDNERFRRREDAQLAVEAAELETRS